MRISDWSSDVCSSEASRRFGIPQAWIWAVMRAESAGDVRAVSHAGALGLMQIMPATWTYLRGRYGLGDDPYHVRDNIIAGTAYLRELHDRFGSEEQTSELQSLMSISNAVFCL